MVLSSLAAVRVRRSAYVYGAAKAGLDAFVVGLAESVSSTSVDVRVVRPGFVRTKMTAGRTPAPFAVNADDVARDVGRALGSDRPVIWSPPAIAWVAAAMQALPGPLWRRLAARL